MKFDIRSLAHAVIDLAETLPATDHMKLFDAALHMLEQRGLSREIRNFPKVLKTEWHKKNNSVPASLVTPSGDERLDVSVQTALEQFETHVRSSLPSLS